MDETSATRAKLVEGKSVGELIGAMPQAFRPEKARGVHAVIQFMVSGQGGGNWTFSVQDGTCSVTEGVSPAAQATIRMDAATFTDFAAGRLAGVKAYMTGKLKVSGDVLLLKKMQDWFPVEM